MAQPIRRALAFYEGLAARFVAPYGDDINDGYDWRFPKQTILSAYDSLPDSGGSISIMDGSYVGGEVEGQGIWLTGAPLFVPGAQLYPGWRLTKAVQFFGCGPVVNGSKGQFAYPMARIMPGRPGDTTKPDPEFDALIWVTANGDNSMIFQNLFLFGTSIGFRFGVDGNPDEDPFSPAQRMSDPNTTAGILVSQCCVQNNGAGHDIGEGPAVDMGYVLFLYFNQCSFSVPATGAPIDDDRHAAILSKPGSGSSQIHLNNCRGGQGGIKYYVVGSSWGLQIQNYIVESDGHDIPPAVWIIDANEFGDASLNNVETADYGAGSMPVIKIDRDGFSANSSQVIVNGRAAASADFAAGLVMQGGIARAASFFQTNILSSLKNGFVGGKLIGNGDQGRGAIPVVSSPYWNYIPQHEDDGGITGPVVAQPNVPSGNLIYTATGATGGHGVDSPVRDKWGGTKAWRISSSDSSVAENGAFDARFYELEVGDMILGGVWARSVNGMPPTGPVMSLQPRASLGQPSCDAEYFVHTGSDGSGGAFPPFVGDGEWQWIAVGLKITDLNGGDGTQIVKFATMGWQDWPIEFCGAVMWRIPKDTSSPNELVSLLNSVGSVGQCKAGMASTQLGQPLAALGGLAPGNLIAAAAVGSTVKLLPLLDPITGSIAGYVEVKPLA